MKINKYRLAKPINMINTLLVILVLIFLIVSRSWARIIFNVGILANCLFYLFLFMKTPKNKIIIVLGIVIASQVAILNLDGMAKNMLFEKGPFVYKNDMKDIIYILEKEGLYDSFIDNEHYISVRDNLLSKRLFIKKSDIDKYFKEAILLSKKNEMSYSYIKIIDNKVKEAKTSESLESTDNIFIDSSEGTFEYIKINKFTDDEVLQFKKRLSESTNKNLVIDLRGNSGGKESALVDIASRLLPKGQEIHTSHYRYSKRTYFSKGSNFDFENLFFLVDSLTASSAEILPLSLKNYDDERVKIIGNETYGKNVGQSVSKYFRSGIEIVVVTSKWTVSESDIYTLYEYIEIDSGGNIFENDQDYFDFIMSFFIE
ncbi:UNVERIFIED_CONTAM: Periplasmic protease [Acetivibrio alkalicellulosi]